MDDSRSPAAEAARTVTAAENVLRLLKYFEHGDDIRVKVACDELGLSRSTVHRLLRTLESQGFVEHRPEGRAWGPGPTLRAIAHVPRWNADVGTLPGAVEKLSKRTRETVHLAVLEGKDVRYIGSVEGDQTVRTASRVGWTLPAHLTAGGKALLADHDDADVLAAFPTEMILGGPGYPNILRSDLLAELELVRARGYATNHGQAEPNVSAVAAVLRNPPRDPPVAIVVTAPRTRGDLDWIRATGPLVVAFTASD